LNYCPSHTDGGLLVADFQVTPDEEIEQLFVTPNFPEVFKTESFFGSNDGFFEDVGLIHTKIILSEK
jgi:hypothetical protein